MLIFPGRVFAEVSFPVWEGPGSRARALLGPGPYGPCPILWARPNGPIILWARAHEVSGTRDRFPDARDQFLDTRDQFLDTRDPKNPGTPFLAGKKAPAMANQCRLVQRGHEPLGFMGSHDPHGAHGMERMAPWGPWTP